MLHEATYCISIRYTYKLLSPNFPLSHEFRSSNASPAEHRVNFNWPSFRVKGFAIRGWADEVWPHLVLEVLLTNCSHVRPSWLLNSNLITSAFCCLPQFLRLLDTPRCSFFLQLSYPGLTTRNEQCSSWIPSQGDHFWFVARRSAVDSSAAWSNILHHYLVHMQAFVPVLRFLTWIQIFQCKSSQAPREQKLTLSQGERVCQQEMGRLGCIISFSKYSSTNFSHVRPSWLLSSKLFTSVFCWSAQFRLFLDTPQSSFFRQTFRFFIVSRAIHQERAVFLVHIFSRGSFVICFPTLWCWLKCCMKQHTASASGTRTSFCPRISLCHMSSDLPMQVQPSTTWTKTDAQSGWKGLPAGDGQIGVPSSRSRSTPAPISPTFALVGSSAPTYSLLISAAWRNFDAFWLITGAASLDYSLALSSYPGLSIRNEQCSSWVPSQWTHVIICDLLPDALVFIRNPFLADIHLP